MKACWRDSYLAATRSLASCWRPLRAGSTTTAPSTLWPSSPSHCHRHVSGKAVHLSRGLVPLLVIGTTAAWTTIARPSGSSVNWRCFSSLLPPHQQQQYISSHGCRRLLSMSRTEYKTLSAPATYEEIIKKSRFIAQAIPVESFDAAQDFLHRVSDPKASHNCWAYRGQGGEERCSDDGEPGGTAGRPMLGAIEAEGLKDVMVVVTRYFGGIKLGSGGLVRAYAGVTRTCLRNAEVETRSPAVVLRITAPLACAGGVYNALGVKAVRLGETYEDDKLVLRVRVPLEMVGLMHRAVQDASRGAGLVEEEDEEVEAAPPVDG